MTEPSHGTRKQYQAGCTCLPCKAANAQYMANLRRQHVHGKAPLGSHIPAAETHRLIARLLVERFTGRMINRESGLKNHALVVHSAITFRKLFRIRRIDRLYMQGEGPDQPLDAGQ